MGNKELETWLSETKAKNLSLDELESFIEFVPTCPHSTVWSKLKGETNEEKAQILFNQWQQENELKEVKIDLNGFPQSTIDHFTKKNPNMGDNSNLANQDENRFIVFKEAEFSPKIIGYKVPFDIFNGNLKKGQIINPLNKKSNANGIELWQTENNNEGWTLPKEIVETWEAVYEPLPTEQPTETDFKSKFEATIELIEKTIKEYDEAKEVAVSEYDYGDASKYILIKETFEVFLKVVKEQL